MNKFGFGIVGCGVISKWHAAAILQLDNAELKGVFDNYKPGAENFAKEYNCTIFDTYEDMLKSKDIDVVCICTPSGLHAPLAIKAAEYKKNIVVEKPVAINKEQISMLINAVEENKVKMAVISQLRFTDAVKKIKDAIDDGVLGEILSADVYMKYYRSPEYYSSSSWRGTWNMDGGGALMNQGIHGIDILQYLAGKVISVTAVCKTLAREIEVEDIANVLLEFENGAVGVIQGTTCVEPGYPRIIQISGTKGTIELTEDVITKWDIKDKNVELKQESGKFKSFSDPTALDMSSHVAQIRDLTEAIIENRSPVVDIYEGRKPVDIILAAYESDEKECKVYL